MSTVFVSSSVQGCCFAFNGACANIKVSACSQVNAALNKFVNPTAFHRFRFGLVFKMEFIAAIKFSSRRRITKTLRVL